MKPEKIRLAIRVWVGDRMVDQRRITATMDELDELLPKLGEEHGVLMKDEPGMIEIEFLDELNPLERFIRFGTDPRRMVRPIALN